MTHRLQILCCCFCLLATCLPAMVIEVTRAADQAGVADQAGLPLPQEMPSLADIRQRWNEHLRHAETSRVQREQVLSLWNPAEGDSSSVERLGKIVASIAILEPDLVRTATAARLGDAELTDAWLGEKEVPRLLREHLQLWIAQGWIQQGRTTQAHALLEAIAPDKLLDPVSYAFALGVIYHQRADKKEGLRMLQWLHEHEDTVPQRYQVLAELMYDDLQQLEEGSLDDISRRMKQIRQQLHLGRTGEGVLRTEDEVIRMLDKLIEEESKKQADQASAVASGAPLRPAEESRPLGGKGPGQVTKKQLGQSTGWGDLPPKEREQAMQEISRAFPAHYREVIEAYFRELARQQK